MKRVDIGMRPKRFKVLHEGSVELVIEIDSGAKLIGKVTDASLKGIAALFTKEDVEQYLGDSIDIGEIVPESKLRWDNRECPLGRLTLIRRTDISDLGVVVAMSCIDTRIPLTGHIAKHFIEIDRGTASPLDFELNAPRYSLANFVEAEFQHPDLFERCRQYQVLLSQSKRNPLFQYYCVKENDEGARARYRLPNSRSTLDAVSFASYDYLGLSKDQRIIVAAQEAMQKYGTSPTGSMILAGKTEIHEELEYETARWLQKDDALIFSSGFSANLGTLTGLLRADDLVVSDIYSHASIMDGIAASKATARFYKHNDMDNLGQLLGKHRDGYNGAMVITEGVFSMEGSTPDLRKFLKYAKQHNCRSYVDECHSFGLFGSRGLGVSDRDKVLAQVDVYMATFSKGLGVGGVGFVAGDKVVIEWLRYFARAGIFSAAVPPGAVAAALQAVKIASQEDNHRKKLQKNIDAFREGLRTLDLETSADPESPIIPIVIDDEAKLGRMNQTMLDMGVFVNCVLFPAVPVGQSRFRFSLTAKHNQSDIEIAINALKIAMEREKAAGPVEAAPVIELKKAS